MKVCYHFAIKSGCLSPQSGLNRAFAGSFSYSHSLKFKKYTVFSLISRLIFYKNRRFIFYIYTVSSETVSKSYQIICGIFWSGRLKYPADNSFHLSLRHS